jgi:GntR family transcriptional regulator
MKNDAKPVYLKLRDVIAAAILDGDYKEGDMLPSVRAFAADQLFQDSGLVDVKRGVGLFVASGAVTKLRGFERDHFVKNVWPDVKAQMRRAGIDPAELLALS